MDGQTAPARDAGIDLVKAAAICGVLVLHTASDGLALPPGSAGWLASAFWGCLVRAGVPLFFMCSGALLLPPEKDLPLRRLYGRNILHIVAAMLVWALGYKLLHLAAAGSLSLPALWQAVKEILVFRQEFHLYYLHITLLVYAFLPLTRLIVRHASETELRYALGLWLILGIVFPTLRPYWPFTLLSDIPLQWMLNMSYAAIGYGLLGYALARRLPGVGIAAALTAAGFALVFAPTVGLSLRSGALEQRFLEGMSVGVCVLAAGLYSLLCRLGRRLRGRGAKGVSVLSKASFCIFLVHVAWLEAFRALGLTAAAFAPLVSIPLLALGNAALSFLCWLLLSRIPIVRRWLI